MNKTPEEIKKGLEYVSATNIARKVQLAKEGRMPYAYTEEVAADALAYIRQLELELEEYDEPLEPLPFDEMLSVVEHEENQPLYWLDRNGRGHWALTFQLGHNVDFDNQAVIDAIESKYGREYLLFWRKPTDEEIKAVKWDD